MKILHYINNLGSGGAENLLSDMLPIMKERGNDVHLVVSNGNANVPRSEEKLQKGDIPVTDHRYWFYNPFQVVTMIRLLRKERYDVVHAHLFPTQYWLAFASLFAPKHTMFVKTEHSVFNERKKYRILRPLEKWVYRRYHKIIAITEQVAENLQAWIGTPQKIVVIENGVNLKAIEAGKKVPLSEDINTTSFCILMVARFDFFQKDQQTLIEAFSKLPDIEKFHLYFAGEGPNRQHMETLAKELEVAAHITFLGMRQDVYTLMHHVDLNILSTKHEGLSGVTLESLASGKPFLGSDVVGVNNVVPNPSFLFPQGNADVLATKILEIKDDAALRSELVTAAAKHVAQYDIPIMASRYLELYETVLS